MDLREHWPLVVGAAILFVGHVYLYGVRGAEWRPASPPLLVAVAFVIVAEAVRYLLSGRGAS